MNEHENQLESMKNQESTLGKHENQPKIVKKHNIVNDGQIRIIATVAMVTYRIASLSKKDYRHRIATKI